MQNKVDIVNKYPEIMADKVFEALHSVMHHLRALHFKALRDGGFDLTHMETRALGFFARHPAATPSDLVVHSGRDKAQIARLIGNLKDKGLLAARANDDDRRSLRLHLTAAGQQMWEQMHGQTLQLQGKAIAGLSEEECHQLMALLRTIDDSLAEPAA